MLTSGVPNQSVLELNGDTQNLAKFCGLFNIYQFN